MKRRGESASFRLGCLKKLRGRIGSDQPAFRKQRNSRAQVERFPYVVSDEHNCLVQPRRKRPKFPLEIRPRHGIERSERLIHQEDWGICRERPRHAHALLLAA